MMLVTLILSGCKKETEATIEIEDKQEEVIQSITEEKKAEEKVVYTFTPEEEFKVFNEGNGIFRIEGEKIERLFERTNLKDTDSALRFARAMSKMKGDEAVREKGCKNGDQVFINDTSFEFVDGDDEDEFE